MTKETVPDYAVPMDECKYCGDYYWVMKSDFTNPAKDVRYCSKRCRLCDEISSKDTDEDIVLLRHCHFIIK